MKRLLIIFSLFLHVCFADQTSKSFIEVSKKSTPAVVSIQVKGQGRGRASEISPEEELWQHFFGIPKKRPRGKQEPALLGQASGFIVSPDGYILTNSHVIRDADAILVSFNDNSEYTGKVVGHDPNTDLAVLKIDATSLPHLKLGDSDDLEVGQWVLAIGNPLGLQASVTSGIISAKGRNNLDLLNIEDFIQTDAAINMGNSGGPLINLNGEVVGINTAIASNVGGYMGIGFAVPSNIASRIMDQLIDSGAVSRGFLGVNMQPLDNDLAQSFGLSKAEGALVSDVQKGSPADQAGIQQGDIILKLNNQDIPNRTALRNRISLMDPGTKVNLTILRDGKKKALSLKIGAFPTAETYTVAQQNKLGFSVENITPEISRNLNLVDEEGVVISHVDPESPAAFAGIRRGALILAVNHKKVRNSDEANAILGKVEKGKPVLLLVKQGDVTRFISLNP